MSVIGVPRYGFGNSMILAARASDRHDSHY